MKPARGDWLAAAAAAIAAPALIAVNVAPSATFFNQAAALVGWGVWAALLAMALPPRGATGRAPDRGAIALLTALLLLAAAALAAPFWAA
ncbi:MAG TPA: hypothetical protein PKZ28_07140 [Piscinibacter sp.]|nr:hypothetical protein [Piscinibacter sp.]